MQRELAQMLRGHDRPSMTEVKRRLQQRAKILRVRAPSRASIYNFLPRCPPHRYAIAELPEWVRAALYNLTTGTVPGHQLVFYAFQYGDSRAMCFAASLPWIDLYLADRMRGWRARSHGLLRAAMKYRAIA